MRCNSLSTRGTRRSNASWSPLHQLTRSSVISEREDILINHLTGHPSDSQSKTQPLNSDDSLNADSVRYVMEAPNDLILGTTDCLPVDKSIVNSEAIYIAIPT